MTTSVLIDGVVEFAPNRGVLVYPDIRSKGPVEICRILALAFDYIDNQWLREACHGAKGPLADLGQIPFDDFLVKIQRADLEFHTRTVKKSFTSMRRMEFAAKRLDLCLALIDKGIPYQCAQHGCGEIHDLTLDHIIPLSRGGSDELTNLQFMCGAHNSAKGDRIR